MKLVLIPGLDGTADLFADFVRALNTIHPARDLHCQPIAYPPDREMSYAGHEAYVRERLPADDFVLLAESFSGPVGISIAAAPPSSLKGLILCCSFASNPLPLFGPLSRLIAAFPAMKIPASLFAPFLYSGRATPELRRAHGNAMAKVKASALRARVAAILAVDHTAQLRKIEVPVLYLRAQQDRLVPAAALRKIERIRPDVFVEEFDAPHFLLQTEPFRCANAVLRFLEYPVMSKTEPTDASN
jgi:pimeloyl-ACP methyl ester carboxylesterase